MAEGEADASTAGRLRALVALLAALASVPLGWSLKTTPVAETVAAKDEANATAPSARRSMQPSAEPPDPSQLCLERFIRPFQKVAGSLGGELQSGSAESWDISLPTTEPPLLATVSKRHSSPPRKWTEVVDAVMEQARASVGGTDLEVIIASVADPIDSGLGYKFDTALQALRLGVEHSLGNNNNYYRDQAWLPWDDRELASDLREASARCRHTFPGVLLFRGGDAHRPKLLVLLLIGETPKSGLHSTAMVRALQIASRVEPSSPELSIVGPAFSGSAQSFRLALAKWAALPDTPGPSSIQITTGSASGPALPEQLRTGPKSWLPGKQVAFAATTAPEGDVLCSYLRFLHYRLGVGDAHPESPLQAVALLHESGTEFGALSETPRNCPLKAGVDIAFPAQVSLIRDAYELMDRNGSEAETTIARRTSLDVSLRESHVALNLEAAPSSTTTFAQDIALSGVLGLISRKQVRHVGIQATDVADAIFLARKIHDVSPDVRIAFFTSDVLLMHPTYERDLMGSLLVSPYPFLGTSIFRSPWLRDLPPTAAGSVGDSTADTYPRDAFENAASQGIFNAMLAARGATVDQLREYSYGSLARVLPIWTATVTAGGVVPISVLPSHDAASTAKFAQPSPEEKSARAGTDTVGDYQAIRQRFATTLLELEGGSKMPRSWHVVFVLLLMLVIIDYSARRRALAWFSEEPIKLDSLGPTDSTAELAICRTKWRLYATIRAHALTFALTYMALLYALASSTMPGYRLRWGSYAYWSGAISLMAIVVVAWVVSGLAAIAFVRDYYALWRCVLGGSVFNWLKRRLGRRLTGDSVDRRNEAQQRRRPSFWTISGIEYPQDWCAAIQTSFGQLSILGALASVVAFLFSVGEVAVVLGDAKWADAPWNPVPATTLLVVRSLTLVGGASPVTPILVAAGLVYLWAMGRMAKLRLMHGVCRMSPKVDELVSTPIGFLLFPDGGAQRTSAAALAEGERRLVNAIVRPITGPYYVAALAIMVLLPLVLFMLKPPSTLERPEGTVLLAAALGLGALLIGSTLIQLVQYWSALELLLKLIFQHRLGRAFSRVARFVRDSVDDHVSRSPHDVLRLASCVTRFDELARSCKPLAGFFDADRSLLEELRKTASEKREAAIYYAARRDWRNAADAEAELGIQVIMAAKHVMQVLVAAWDGGDANTAYPRPNPPSAGPGIRTTLPPTPRTGFSSPPQSIEAGSDHDPLSTDEALAAEHWRYTAEEIRWLRDAEAFAATVTIIVVNRHLRQFKYFMYTLTGCALALLVAVTSYPFQPYRLLLTCIWVLVCSVVVAGFWVYVEMDRNSLISRVAGTPAGKLTWDSALALRIIAFGVIPLLGVAAAQYPDVANHLFRWIEPFTRALH